MVTLELSEVTEVLVVVEVSSTFLSGVRPLLGDRRLGVTVVCCVNFRTGESSDVFCDGGRPRLLAGDRDRERALPGDLDLLRAGLRDGEAERERNLCSFYNETQKFQVRRELRYISIQRYIL